MIDASIDHWEQVIQRLQRPLTPGDETLEVTVNANSADPGSCGGSAGANFDALGWPTSGNININGLANIWFVDPTPNDHSEFLGNIENAFAGDAHAGSPAAGLCDMYTVINAEMNHVMGLINGANRFQTGGFNTPLTVSGTTCSGPGNLYRFTGPSEIHLMTSNNGGGGGSDFGVPIHTAEPCGSNAGLVGANDGGNALFEGSRRYLVPNSTALLLKDSYNYQIQMPETFGTFYSVINQTTGLLTVRGGDAGDTSADVITITRVGNEIVSSVDIGNDVAATGPTDAFETKIPAGQVKSIEIDAGDGADKITIGDTVNVPVTVNGGSGNDIITGIGIIANGGSGNDTLTGGPTADTLNGDAGDDEIYAHAGADTIDGGSEDDLIYAADGDDAVTAGSGNDRVYAGTGSNDVTDGTGDDVIDLTLNDEALDYTTGGGSDTILGSIYNDTIRGGSSSDRLEGNAGNDLLIGQGDADTLMGGTGSDIFDWDAGDGSDLIEGGAGESDLVTAAGHGGSDSAIARTGTGSRLAVGFGSATLDIGSAEALTVDAAGGDDAIRVEDLSSTEVRKVTAGLGDGTDELSVRAREASDALGVSPITSGAAVSGLPYQLSVVNTDSADTMQVAGLGGNDSLLVDGTSATESFSFAPTSADAAVLGGVGPLNIAATTIEQISVEGRGGGDTLRVTSPTGANNVAVSPGAASDAGVTTIAGLMPLQWGSLGASSSLVLGDEGGVRSDAVTVQGNAGDDAFGVTDDTVALNGRTPVVAEGAESLVLNGASGDDTFTAAAGLPFSYTTVNGGDSTQADKLAMVGSGAPVTVDTENDSIGGFGGLVLVNGIESLSTGQTGSAAAALTVLGATTPDKMLYRPTGAQTGVVTAEGFVPTLSFSGVGGDFLIDPLGDSDIVSVQGTFGDDTLKAFALPLTTAQVNNTKTVRIPQASAERIHLLSDEGSDTYDISTFSSVAGRLFLYGDSPSAKRFSDGVIVRNGDAAKVQFNDVKSHTFEDGSITAFYRNTSNVTRLDYVGVESVKFVR